MINQLISTILSSKKTFKKEDLLTLVNNIDSAMSNEIPELIQMLSDMFKEHNDMFDGLTALTQVNEYSGIDAYTPSLLLKNILTTNNKISKDIIKVKEYVDSEFEELINSNMNARQAAIITYIQDLNSYVHFLSDLILFTMEEKKVTELSNADLKSDFNDDLFNKKKIKEFKKGIVSFSSILKVFTEESDKIIKDIAKVSLMEVSVDSAAKSTMDRELKKSGKILLMPITNFVGNPIYYFRMWLVDKEIEKYKNLKEKHKLLQLKVLDLKSTLEDNPSPKIQKQIEYYEELISEVEYKLKKIED